MPRSFNGFAKHVWKDGAPAFSHIYPTEAQVVCCGVTRPIVPLLITEVEAEAATHWAIISNEIRFAHAMLSPKVAQLTAGRGEAVIPVTIELAPDAPPHPGMWFQQAVEQIQGERNKAIRRLAWEPEYFLTLSEDGLHRWLHKRTGEKYPSLEAKVSPGTLPFPDDRDQVDWEVVNIYEDA